MWRGCETALPESENQESNSPRKSLPSCFNTCADHLGPVFTKIFNRSLKMCQVPSCFKLSTIIPVPTKPSVTGLNDSRTITVFWMTSVGPSEEDYRSPARSTAVCLQGKLFSGWFRQHGTALHSATSWLPFLQTLPAQCLTCLMSVDHQLPDRQATESKAERHHFRYVGQSSLVLLRGMSSPRCSSSFTPMIASPWTQLLNWNLQMRLQL